MVTLTRVLPVPGVHSLYRSALPCEGYRRPVRSPLSLGMTKRCACRAAASWLTKYGSETACIHFACATLTGGSPGHHSVIGASVQLSPQPCYPRF
jgi:hypothetical protein